MMTLRGHQGNHDAAPMTTPSASQVQSGGDRSDAQLASSPTIVVDQASTPQIFDTRAGATSKQGLDTDTVTHIDSETASSQEARNQAAASFSASAVSSAVGTSNVSFSHH
jgi:hypothetical protein